MKKILIAAVALCSTAAYAQKTPAKKPAAPAQAPALKTFDDSVSYAMGLSVANFYSQQGVKNVNPAMVAQAVKDVFNKKQPLLDETVANSVVMRCMEQAQADKAKPVMEASEKFLAENKKRPEVKTTASGLQYEVIREGNGPKPTATDTVKVNYAGTLIDGTEFDNSYKRGQPIEFPLNRVIAGWTEGVQLMPVGSKYKFYIPQQLGYGMRGAGTIPPGAALVFEVELLEIKGK
ncbi:MAG: FKBP-type peptidyl-prolyl cis-trans isomerase [Flavisolibacter sp.]